MTKKQISLPRVIVSATLKLGSFFVLFFAGAGRLDYWQGWGFAVLLLGTSITAFILFQKNKALFEERLKPGTGMKWWDKIFWFFNIFLFMGILVVGILDGDSKELEGYKGYSKKTRFRLIPGLWAF